MQVRFSKWDCELAWHRYDNDRIALELVDATDGGRVTMATVNVPEAALAPDEVIIKNYSENEGLLDALVAAGVVESTGQTVRSGYVEFPICRLLVIPPVVTS